MNIPGDRKPQIGRNGGKRTEEAVSQNVQGSTPSAESSLLQREATVKPSKARRTDIPKNEVHGLVDELRNGNIIGSHAKFEKLKEIFKKYEMVGIEFPKEIVVDSMGFVSLNEQQANQLKELSDYGDKKLFERYGPYGEFGIEDITKKVASEKGGEGLLSVSKTLLELKDSSKEKRIVLTVSQFCDPENEGAQFARGPDGSMHKLRIKFETDDDFSKMLDFMQNQDNKDLLNRMEALDFQDITNENVDEFGELYTLLAPNCPNLASLSFRGFYDCEAVLEEGFANVRSFSCEIIKNSNIAIRLPNLNEFSCGEINKTYHDNEAFFLIDLNHLRKISVGVIKETNVQILDNENLEELSIENISGCQAGVFVEGNSNLTNLSLGNIIDSTVTVSDVPKLSQYTHGDIVNSTVNIEGKSEI